MISILPCTLEDSSKCASAIEMFRFSIYLFLPKFGFKREDFEKPITMNPTVAFSSGINYQVAKKRRIFFKENIIYDDKMDFFPVTEKARFVEIDNIEVNNYPRPDATVHCTKKQVATFTCVPYIQLEFRPSGKITKITRSYKKLLSVFGEIGGTSKTFFTVASIAMIVLGGLILRKRK